ncbi:MAG: alpha-hydroxy-acid oxidizing enzyme [Bacteroidetes bacterium]|nr:MAG: alpha-hydroxy-acid oxidizing enzyme [Bacteroidota bacterium]
MKQQEITISFNPRYPSVSDLRRKAKKRIPRFAFEYLDGGCNDDVNLNRNTEDLQALQLMPYYLRKFKEPIMRTELFGHTYEAPFGIAPIGLQGLIWPNAPEILAKAALKHNIPFILSTVSSASIERIAEVSEGSAWFQLYHPKSEQMRKDIIERANSAGMRVLVVLVDVPSFGFRPRDIRNGLAMPPKMNWQNIFQMISKPTWGIRTLQAGGPSFKTLKPYMPKGLSMAKLGQFMNDTFSGRMDLERIKPIRDLWKGPLVLKGIVNPQDLEEALSLGIDGIIVSNHGGRQIDAGESSIRSLQNLVKTHKGKTHLMMDSGLRSGTDIARSLACGANFTFLGRPFMYGVGALGTKGGDHIISVLKAQLKQVMEQIGCSETDRFEEFLIR